MEIKRDSNVLQIEELVGKKLLLGRDYCSIMRLKLHENKGKYTFSVYKFRPSNSHKNILTISLYVLLSI